MVGKQSMPVPARPAPKAARPSPLQRYSATASKSSRVVIRNYSTSFSFACRLLDADTRGHVANVYALVRLADEVVDGVAHEAGLSIAATSQALDGLEEETESALNSGYSTNMVVHAFAATARRHGIDTALTRPFFASMRSDLRVSSHDADTLESYIHGSAEVVGLMCLRIFIPQAHARPAGSESVEIAAQRLGAAFQKVNFLRDLATDSTDLGRSYFPGLDPACFSDQHKNQLVAEINRDLDAAAAGIPALPPGARRAVSMAHGLFSELNRRLARTSAAELMTSRVTVPAWRKTAIAVQAVLGGPPRASGTATLPRPLGRPA